MIDMPERPIRVVMMVQYPSRSGVITGGVEGVGFSLVSAMRKIAGVTVDVVSPIAKSALAVAEAEVPEVHWVGNSRLPGFLNYWTFQRIQLQRKVSELAPDIVHFHGAAGSTIGYRGAAVLTIHGIVERDALFTGRMFPRVRSKLMQYVESYARRRVRDVILISPYLAAQLADSLSGESWNIENPIEESWFAVKRAPEKKRVLYVGRISARKNVDGLLRAFRKVVEKLPEAKLVLAGSAEEATFERACSNYVEESGIRKNVEFLGNLSRTNLKYEMARASCLVLLSHQETAPLVIEEAMAAGVPVIASNVCGHPFMIRDGVTGFLVNQLSAVDIAERLYSLLTDSALNMAIGESARKEAVMRFHPDAVARATVDVYKKILSRVEVRGK
jgi:glycosyltransferase involved in cell wall biosynthesis